jgi:hypothetical protein
MVATLDGRRLVRQTGICMRWKYVGGGGMESILRAVDAAGKIPDGRTDLLTSGRFRTFAITCVLIWTSRPDSLDTALRTRSTDINKHSAPPINVKLASL